MRVVARLGRLPTVAEAVAEAGGISIQQAIHLCGGLSTLHALVDPTLPTLRLPRGHWERRDILVALARRVRQETGSTPTWQGLVRAAGNSTVGHGIRRVGGMATVVRWLQEDDAATALMDVAA